MANNEDMFNSVVSPSARKALEKQTAASTGKILKTQNGLAADDLNIAGEVDGLVGQVNASINAIFAKLTPSGNSPSDISGNTVDSMLALAKQQHTKGMKRNGKLNQKTTKALESLRDSEVGGNRMHIEQLLS